jgi:MoaA/NifB/PqqE/SkfB family radical SAM enzyme
MNQIVAIEDNFAPKDNWLRVEWNLGKRCNYDCSYCGIDLHDNHSTHMPLEKFNAAITQLIAIGKQQNKKVKISLTGGEPFVNPNILEMLKFGKESGIFKFSVTTNGSVPLDKYNKALDYIDYFIISYHFEFAFHEKVIHKIVELDRACKKRQQLGQNKNMHVHLMFLPGYLEQCKEIINILNENNISYAVRRIRPQFDPNTKEYLLPNQSGAAGIPLYNMGKINQSNLKPYYSDEELIWLSTVN